jgi:hypothetical protein
MELHGPSDIGKGAARKAPLADARSAAPAEKADMLNAASQPYIRKAAASEEVDLQAIAEAKKLLASGELDTPAAAQRAAERILSTGI